MFLLILPFFLSFPFSLSSWKIPEEFSLPPSNSPPQPSPSTRASPPTESTNKARIPEGSTSLAQQLEDAAQLHLESNVEDTASASEISSAFIPSLKGRERVEHFQRLRSLEVSESEDDGDRPPAAGERNSQLEVQCHSEHLILREKSAEEKKSFNMMADNTENLSQSEIRPLSESPAFELEQACAPFFILSLFYRALLTGEFLYRPSPVNEILLAKSHA